MSKWLWRVTLKRAYMLYLMSISIFVLVVFPLHQILQGCALPCGNWKDGCTFWFLFVILLFLAQKKQSMYSNSNKVTFVSWYYMPKGNLWTLKVCIQIAKRQHWFKLEKIDEQKPADQFNNWVFEESRCWFRVGRLLCYHQNIIKLL